MNYNKRLIFYDFESFKHDWMVVIVDYQTKKGKVIVNDRDMLERYYNLFKDDIWIGYNSRGYDQYIHKGLLLGMNPFYITQQIIVNGVKGHNVVRDAWKIKLNNFDLSNKFRSLKELEAFMGSRIKESSVPFDINRPLTLEEIKEVIDYCKHDVFQTIEVFDNWREEFDSQLELIETFNLDMSLFNKTKAQLSAFILGAKKQERNDEFNFTFPDTIRLKKYKYVMDWYIDPKNRRYTDDNGKKVQLKTEVAGVEHVFGYGGVHAAIPKFQYKGIILCCDVASLYPSIMIEYGFLSRNVKEPEKFREIRDTRLIYKRKKDKRQAPLKIVINSTFGASKDQFNPLYDPLMANNVCIAGQLLLLDLIEKVEPYCKIFNTNTDGIFMAVEKESDINIIKSIAKEWEQRTRLNLEWDIYEKVYQKDVNGYIIIDKNGKYKSKGSYVKELNNLDYDLPIVNKALIDYFTKGTSIKETINNCDELREFQKVVKVTNKYLCSMHGDQRLPEKVLRVFASKDDNAQGVFKLKLKMKDGIEQEVPEKIANTPERCFINNDDIKGVKVPDELDKQYYIDLAQKRLNDFLGISNKKPKKKKAESEQLEIKL